MTDLSGSDALRRNPFLWTLCVHSTRRGAPKGVRSHAERGNEDNWLEYWGIGVKEGPINGGDYKADNA